MSYEDELRQLRDLRRKFEDPMPQTVYHYTSTEGFRGIVTSGELWLTNAAFLNDTTECKAFLRDCAKHLLNDERLANEDVKETLKFRLEDGPENDNYYVASFSKERDCLPQYRAYGSVCVGFDPHKMNKSPFAFYECVYAQEEIEDWFCCKSTLPDWDKLRDGDSRYAAPDVYFAAQVKHKDANYRNEREVRMVGVSYCSCNLFSPLTRALAPRTAMDAGRDLYASSPPIHFRDHPVLGMPVPYVKFFITDGEMGDAVPPPTPTETVAQMSRRKLKQEERKLRELLPITEVWIGPMARQKEAKLACEIMLQGMGYEDVKVEVSAIPYRGI